jgi:diguanylate cyclase (GGDEF)-like protein/PAS domain S-box-containing protein
MTAMKKAQRILVLEDDNNDFLLIEDKLLAACGSAVKTDWADTASKASELLEKYSYDVCLVDYYLGSGTNGLEWTKSWISALGSTCPPVIMLTGIESYENIDLRASESGISDFLNKSELTPAILEHSIRYAIQNRHMMRELLRNETRFHLFFDHAYEGILLLDRNGQVLQANHSAELMFCYAKHTMEGLYIHQLIHDFTLQYDLLNNTGTMSEVPGTMERITGRDQHGRKINLEMGINKAEADDGTFYSVSLINIHHHIAKQEELIKLAHTDTLTGLKNRRYFRQLADQEIARATRTREQLFIMMLDIDYFKRVNDTHGHDVGDLALIAIAEILKKCIRKMDVLARWGGEEFLVMMPETNLTGASLIAERIRHQVSLLKLPEIPEGLTISIGLSQVKPNMELKTATNLADQALYQAKIKGRNRVVSL